MRNLSVYVADASGPGFVWVINPATNAVTASVPVESGGYPTGVAVTPNGALVYVTNFLTLNVSVLNTANNAVTQIPINDESYGVAITPNVALRLCRRWHKRVCDIHGHECNCCHRAGRR